MSNSLLTLLFAAALVVAPAGAGQVQKKPDKCEQGPRTERNWEQMDKEYVSFDYILCPADLTPREPLVRVWLTWSGKGLAVEKWASDRDGADLVVMYHGKTKAYTLYRDLNAVPLKVFKAESRSVVPVEQARQPFLREDPNLIPFENLTPESSERVKKVFENADVLIKKAQSKVSLLYESPRITTIVESLQSSLKEQK